MDALTLLREDHERMLAMFDRLALEPSATTGATREQLRARKDLVTELIIAASAHEAIEEAHFWPTVRAAVPNGDRLASLAVDQEADAKRMLAKLADLSADEIEFDQLLDLFIADARQHIAYEQDTAWPEVRAALPADRLAELGEKMATAKKLAPTRPHPHTPSDGTTQKTVGVAAGLVDRVRDAVLGRGRDR